MPYRKALIAGLLLCPGLVSGQATPAKAVPQAEDKEVPGSRARSDKPAERQGPAKKEAPKAEPPKKEAPRKDADGDELSVPEGIAGKQVDLQMRYHGVSPGSGELPPGAPKLPLPGGPQRLTWPGFQVRQGVPTVFLQLSGPVEYTVAERSGQVQVTLHDTVVPLRNNLNPLKVEVFNTPVQRVRLQARKQDKQPVVLVTIEVKGAVAHREQLAQAENGFSMLVVQITPSTEAKPEAKTDAKPEAKTETKTEAPAAPAAGAPK